jgi:hypothetical protein
VTGATSLSCSSRLLTQGFAPGKQAAPSSGTTPLISRQSARIHCAALRDGSVGSGWGEDLVRASRNNFGFSLYTAPSPSDYSVEFLHLYILNCLYLVCFSKRDLNKCFTNASRLVKDKKKYFKQYLSYNVRDLYSGGGLFGARV